MTDTEFTLLPLLLNNNEFVWYCVAGYVAIFLPLLILSILLYAKKNQVQLIKNPNSNGFTKQKYLLAFKTSPIPGCGLSESVRVQVCLCGTDGISPLVLLTRPLYPFSSFRRGQQDVFMLHFDKGVGDVTKIVLKLENPEQVHVKWYLKEVSVYEYPYSQKWTFPVRKRIVFDNNVTEFVVNSSISRSSMAWMFVIVEKLLTCHSFISIYGITQYVGGMTTAVNVTLLAATVSLLYMSNLQVYILSHIFESTGVSLPTILVNCLIGHTIVWVMSCCCEVVARNISLKWTFPKGEVRSIKTSKNYIVSTQSKESHTSAVPRTLSSVCSLCLLRRRHDTHDLVSLSNRPSKASQESEASQGSTKVEDLTAQQKPERQELLHSSRSDHATRAGTVYNRLGTIASRDDILSVSYQLSKQSSIVSEVTLKYEPETSQKGEDATVQQQNERSLFESVTRDGTVYNRLGTLTSRDNILSPSSQLSARSSTIPESSHTCESGTSQGSTTGEDSSTQQKTEIGDQTDLPLFERVTRGGTVYNRPGMIPSHNILSPSSELSAQSSIAPEATLGYECGISQEVTKGEKSTMQQRREQDYLCKEVEENLARENHFYAIDPEDVEILQNTAIDLCQNLSFFRPLVDKHEDMKFLEQIHHEISEADRSLTKVLSTVPSSIAPEATLGYECGISQEITKGEKSTTQQRREQDYLYKEEEENLARENHFYAVDPEDVEILQNTAIDLCQNLSLFRSFVDEHEDMKFLEQIHHEISEADRSLAKVLSVVPSSIAPEATLGYECGISQEITKGEKSTTQQRREQDYLYKEVEENLARENHFYAVDPEDVEILQNTAIDLCQNLSLFRSFVDEHEDMKFLEQIHHEISEADRSLAKVLSAVPSSIAPEATLGYECGISQEITKGEKSTTQQRREQDYLYKEVEENPGRENHSYAVDPEDVEILQNTAIDLCQNLSLFRSLVDEHEDMKFLEQIHNEISEADRSLTKVLSTVLRKHSKGKQSATGKKQHPKGTRKQYCMVSQNDLTPTGICPSSAEQIPAESDLTPTGSNSSEQIALTSTCRGSTFSEQIPAENGMTSTDKGPSFSEKNSTESEVTITDGLVSPYQSDLTMTDGPMSHNQSDLTITADRMSPNQSVLTIRFDRFSQNQSNLTITEDRMPHNQSDLALTGGRMSQNQSDLTITTDLSQSAFTLTGKHGSSSKEHATESWGDKTFSIQDEMTEDLTSKSDCTLTGDPMSQNELRSDIETIQPIVVALGKEHVWRAILQNIAVLDRTLRDVDTWTSPRERPIPKEVTAKRIPPQDDVKPNSIFWVEIFDENVTRNGTIYNKGSTTSANLSLLSPDEVQPALSRHRFEHVTRAGTIFNKQQLMNTPDNIPSPSSMLSAQSSISLKLCTCVEMRQKLINTAVSSAQEEFGTDLSDHVFVFQRHLVYRTVMALLRKWKLKCSEKDLLDDVLSDLSRHVQKQGYDRICNPARYLADALICEALSPLFELWQVPGWSSEGYPETLADIDRIQEQLEISLVRSFKSQIRHNLSLFLRNLNPDLRFSRDLHCHKNYILAVFLFFIDDLSERLTDTPRHVFSDFALSQSLQIATTIQIGTSQQQTCDERTAESPMVKPESNSTDTKQDKSQVEVKQSPLTASTWKKITFRQMTSDDGKADSLATKRDTDSSDKKHPGMKSLFRISAWKKATPSVGQRRDVPPHSLEDVCCRLKDDDHTDSVEIRGMRTDLKMLKGYLHYLRFEEKRKQRLDIVEYCSSSRAKMDHFLVTNMQKVVDSHSLYSVEPPVPDEVLQGLWYEVCGATHLSVPWTVYPFLMIVLYLTIIASLVYTTMKGRDLTSDQITEWFLCVLAAILEDFFLFQPLKILFWEFVKKMFLCRRTQHPLDVNAKAKGVFP